MPDTIEQKWVKQAERKLAQARESELHAKAAELKEAEAQRQRAAKEHAEREAQRERTISTVTERATVMAAAEAKAHEALATLMEACESITRERDAIAQLVTELGAGQQDANRLKTAPDEIVRWILGELARRFSRATTRLIGPDIRHVGPLASIGVVISVLKQLGIATEKLATVAGSGAHTDFVATQSFRCAGRDVQPGDVVDNVGGTKMATLVRTGLVVERPRKREQ